MRAKPEHVLVTGAAGLVGRAVLHLLAAERIRATALVLDAADASAAQPAERTVVGDARDPGTVAGALDGVDAVIHLAAIPTPDLDTHDRVFGVNSLATFVVLDQAGRAGVRRAAIAGSYSVLGTAFPAVPVTFPYLPLDLDTPLQISDPYALSKRADEATAAMVHAKYGMDVVALRLPYIGGVGDRLPGMAKQYADDPRSGALVLWSYLESRDAARAMLAALSPLRPGFGVAFVAAPDILCPYPTEELLDRFLPDVPRRRPFPGRTVPIDLAPTAELIDFTAIHPYRYDA